MKLMIFEAMACKVFIKTLNIKALIDYMGLNSMHKLLIKNY